MANNLIPSNTFILKAASLYYSYLQGGAILRLFRNNFTPIPSSTPADFLECNFPNYIGQNVGGRFLAPVLQGTGAALVALPPITFMPAASDSQLVYGAYLTNADGLVCSFVFAFPLNVYLSVPIQVSLQIQDISLAQAC